MGRHDQDTHRVDELAVAGTRVTWRQSVTKPMRLNLDFDVVVGDDRLAGHI